MLYRGLVTLAILLVAIFVQRVLQSSIDRFVAVRQMRKVRGEMVGRISRLVVGFSVIILLISVWGVDPGNLWIFLTGVIGAIAIGFFAMWSLLSNVIAGIMLFISDPFRIDDEIVILPDGIQGIVTDTQLLFVEIRNEEGHALYIPNSLFFQKYIKKVRPSEAVS